MEIQQKFRRRIQIIRGAKSEADAIVQAIDCFKDDDIHYGADYTENVTKDDCEIIWFEES